MADRVLTWFVSGVLSNSKVGADVGPAYRLDANYRPVRVWLRLKSAPSGAPAVVDINDDGTSIFSSAPRIHGVEMKSTHFDVSGAPTMAEGSVVTCDLDSVSSATPGTDLSVALELRKVSDAAS